MTTIDILISLAAERIGCPIAQKPTHDENAPRIVTVTSQVGTDTDVQVPANASLEAVIRLLLTAYKTN